MSVSYVNKVFVSRTMTLEMPYFGLCMCRFECPVAHAATPASVWRMMRRSWLAGQLMTPT